MKTKTSNKPSSTKRKKIKWYDLFITTLAFVVIVGFFVWFVIHNYQEEKIKQKHEEAYKASLPSPGSPVPPNTVCMVNNMYMNAPQIPVVVNNETYYACCTKCVKDLNTNNASHFAIDPLSKRKIDKATAFITIKPDRSGEVLYFQSEENAKLYIRK